MTEEPELTITEHLDRPAKIRFEVSARQGEHAGWALGPTEQQARGKALLRLKAEVQGWWAPIRPEQRQRAEEAEAWLRRFGV